MHVVSLKRSALLPFLFQKNVTKTSHPKKNSRKKSCKELQKVKVKHLQSNPDPFFRALGSRVVKRPFRAEGWSVTFHLLHAVVVGCRFGARTAPQGSRKNPQKIGVEGGRRTVWQCRPPKNKGPSKNLATFLCTPRVFWVFWPNIVS